MDPLPRNTVSIGRACGIAGLFLAFQIACTIPVTALVVLMQGGDLTATMQHMPVLLIIGNTGATACVLGLELRRQKLSWRFTPPARASFAWMLLPTLFATVGTALVGGAVLEGLSSLLPFLFESTELMEELFDIVAHPVAIPLILVVVAPLTEEVIFRGLILGGLLRTRPPATAILLSAVLFSAIHLNLAQLPSTFLIGLVYGWIYYRTRSLPLCIFAHMLNNGMALLATAHELSFDAARGIPPPEPVPASHIFLIGASALALGLGLLHRFTTRPAPETPPPLPPPPPLVTQ